MRVYGLRRDVTRQECDWLDRDYKKHELVYEWTGVTYGAITPDGVAVTAKAGQTPFFELPWDALGEPDILE